MPRATNKVYVVGVGMTKFEKPGRRDGWDYPQMAKESGTKALEDAGVDYAEIEQGYVGYCSGDSTSGQRALYELGLPFEHHLVDGEQGRADLVELWPMGGMPVLVDGETVIPESTLVMEYLDTFAAPADGRPDGCRADGDGHRDPYP